MFSLSVIIARQDERVTGTDCLNALRNQPAISQIIVVDGTHDPNASASDARVEVLHLPGASLPMLIGAGIAVATGDLIAMTEAHCIMDSAWADRMIAAHERTTDPVIGGVVEPGANLSYTDWGLYFADYGQFMRESSDGESNLTPAAEMPGENIAFKRAALDPHRERFVRDGFYKTLFCQDLTRAGFTLYADSSIIVTYHRRLKWGMIVLRRFTHGQCFGGKLAESLAPVQRTARLVGDLLLPIVLSARMIGRVLPKRRHTLRFLWTLPVSLTATLAWSAGEWIGNAFGAGDACEWV